MRNNDKFLIIVESPAKIKTISKFLGSNYKVMSTFGHIKDLPEDKLGVTLDAKSKTVSLDYAVMKGKKTVISDICKQATAVDEILLGSDNDREGEVISWHIGQEIARAAKNKPMHRIVFNEITKPALEKAIANKSVIDMPKVYAQQARRVVDRWVGYEVSPILWRKITKGLSAGRVQSAALLLVCTREKEIQTFVPEESWSITADFAAAKAQLKAELYKINDKLHKIKDKTTAAAAVEKIKKQDEFIVAQITDKQRSKNPLPPFTTSTLQQDAFNKLGFSVDKTMTLAQKLYEGVPLEDKNSPVALITYMRSDSTRLSDTFLDHARKFIDKSLGGKYLPKTAVQYSKSGAQDAHEAIRPVSVQILPENTQKYLEKDLARLYELVWRRAVASQASPALFAQRQILVTGGEFTFKATGSTLIFDGFLKIYKPEEEASGEDAEQTLPDLPKDTALSLKKLTPKQHFTQPPPRYTQASIVKEMEKQGIGRPSTYANTISTIIKREYVIVDKKKFAPTELGNAVTQMLAKNLPDIINISFTAKMEEDLDKIAAGELEKDKVLLDFYKKFSKDLEQFKGSSGGKEPVTINLKCPTCGNDLVIKFSRAGQFAGCSKYPECTFTSNFERLSDGSIKLVEKAVTPIKQLDEKCTQCQSFLVERVGRFGPFVACSAYPKCKYIHQDKLTTPCPQCGKNIVKKMWQKGVLWGCSGYPKCNFAIFGDVVESPCPKCHKPFMLVQKKKSSEHTTLSCTDKECGHTQTQEK